MMPLDANTYRMHQFISASLHNFETIDLGIKSLVPLALDGLVNHNNTLVLVAENIQWLQKPHTKEFPRCSKCILRLTFQGL